jgi:hypothetical protein
MAVTNKTSSIPEALRPVFGGENCFVQKKSAEKQLHCHLCPGYGKLIFVVRNILII